MRLLRYIVGGGLLVVAGLAAMQVGLIAFMDGGGFSGKLFVMSVYGFVFLLSYFLGLAIFPGNVGVAGGTALLVPAATSLFFWLATQAIRYQRNKLAHVNIDDVALYPDYLTGFTVLLLYALIGTAFIFAGRRSEAQGDDTASQAAETTLTQQFNSGEKNAG